SATARRADRQRPNDGNGSTCTGVTRHDVHVGPYNKAWTIAIAVITPAAAAKKTSAGPLNPVGMPLIAAAAANARATIPSAALMYIPAGVFRTTMAWISPYSKRLYASVYRFVLYTCTR